MTIPIELVFHGPHREFQFRDLFVMPLLARLGFGIVVNNHGSREFGRDVVFGDVDRFGHVMYYGMQIKYESSISLGDSHSLVQDAEQAMHNPFRHPQTGRSEYISRFFVANAGDISDQARENFFHVVAGRGIRDSRLLDGNALLLLDRVASLNRNVHIQEILTGLVQEIRVNRNLATLLSEKLQEFIANPNVNPFPILRLRNTAAANYLNAPFAIPNLPVDAVDQYWQLTRMLNDLADSADGPISVADFRKARVDGFMTFAPQSVSHGLMIETAVNSALTQLSTTMPK